MESLPSEVIAMHQRKLKRASVITGRGPMRSSHRPTGIPTSADTNRPAENAPVTCGTGLADRLTAACGNQMLRFLRYPD